jgi:DNA-binding CsgD family transcriptional regulator
VTRRPLLTYRQRQIMVLVANGYTNTRIARQLGIAADTVRGSVRLAYRNLGATSRTHAAVLALHYGEINLTDIQLPAVAPTGTLLMIDQPRKSTRGTEEAA